MEVQRSKTERRNQLRDQTAIRSQNGRITASRCCIASFTATVTWNVLGMISAGKQLPRACIFATFHRDQNIRTRVTSSQLVDFPDMAICLIMLKVARLAKCIVSSGKLSMVYNEKLTNNAHH